MNLFDATLRRDGDGAGGRVRRLPLAGSRRGARRAPALRGYAGRTSCSASGPRTWRTRRSCRERRPTGASRRPSSCARRSAPTSSSTSRIDAPPAMTDDVRELAVDVGEEALEHVEQQARGGRTTVLARLNPRSTVAQGRTDRAGGRHPPPPLLRPRRRHRHLRMTPTLTRRHQRLTEPAKRTCRCSYDTADPCRARAGRGRVRRRR